MGEPYRVTVAAPLGVGKNRWWNLDVQRGQDHFVVPLVVEELVYQTWSVTESEVDDSVMAVGLQRLSAAVESGVVDAGPADPLGAQVEIVLTQREDAEAVRSALTRKACRHQAFEDVDMYCDAAAPDDPAAVSHRGLQTLAPTSHAVCGTCEMPPEPLVCSALRHPKVKDSTHFGPEGISRHLLSAMCADGQPQIRNELLCRFNGHPCWHRTIEAPRAFPSVASPLSLHEAFDFLDAVWQLRFGGHLLARTALATAASLTQAVTDRDDFLSRMTDLSKLMEFSVADDLLPEDVPPKDQRRQGSINRLELALGEAELSVSESAIRALRNVIGIRTALQHQGKSDDLQRRLEALDIRPTVDSWAEMWDKVRGATVAAVVQLRDAVRPQD